MQMKKEYLVVLLFIYSILYISMIGSYLRENQLDIIARTFRNIERRKSGTKKYFDYHNAYR